MTTPIDIAELRRLLGKATPGPWRIRRVETPGDGPDSFAELIDTEARAVVRHPAHGARGANWAPEEADTALIVAAVNSLGPLLDELEAARAESAKLRALVDLAGACACCVEYECDCLEDVRAALEEKP